MVAEKGGRPDGRYGTTADEVQFTGDETQFTGDETQFTSSVDDGERVAEAVVRSVAAVTGDDPMSMAPLGAVLDTDALSELFDRSTSDARLSFSFNGCDVTVHGGTTVRVRVRDE